MVLVIMRGLADVCLPLYICISKMKYYFALCIIIGAPCRTVAEEIYLENDEMHTLKSINYPNPYTTEEQFLAIKCQLGYNIEITVEDVDIDGESGDFLLVKQGSTIEDSGEGKIFTYKLKTLRRLLIYSNEVFIKFVVKGNNENKHKGYSLNYRLFGQPLTTTIAPTTMVNWPMPSNNDAIYLTVYTYGKSAYEFYSEKVLDNFKSCLAAMAREYCATQSVTLSENITNKNVHITRLTQCSYNWPDMKNCAEINFALPVFVKENSTWSGYQLTSVHLEQMWLRLGDKYLSVNNLAIYKEPNNIISFSMWMGITAFLALFFAVLCMVKIYGTNCFIYKDKKRRRSDTVGFIESKIRISGSSLRPHPLQTIPPFFEMDSPVYEPHMYSSPDFTNEYVYPHETERKSTNIPLSQKKESVESDI